MNCDVGEATEGWRTSCDVGEMTESLENEQSCVTKIYVITKKKIFIEVMN